MRKSEVRFLWALAPVALSLVLFAACSESDKADVPVQDVVETIPFQSTETARYRVLDGDDLVGAGVLDVRRDSAGAALTLEQRYDSKDGEFSNVITAVVDADTLRPHNVSREIGGPEGERHCTAEYGQGSVQVVNSSKDDSRTDTLALPPVYYDSAADLFLWRTIHLERGALMAYENIGTCNVFSKPDRVKTTLEVITEERVRVPAGSFDTWRVEMKGDGGTQRFWIAQTPERTLVRYDNGQQVFELESVEKS